MLRIRNWAKFQHYKDRNPPWIKLHVEILSSEDWVTLDDASKLLAVVCMVIGAKHDGDVPDNPDYIKRVAYLQQQPNLGPLIACGFFEKPLADASTLKASARPEKETQDRKQKAETEQKESPSLRSGGARAKARASLPDHFPDDEAVRRAQGFWNERGRPDLAHSVRDEAEQFRDHHLKLGNRFANWPAAWRTWMRTALKFPAKDRLNGHGRRESPLEQSERIAKELIREDASNAGANSGEGYLPRIAVRPAGDERRRAEGVARDLLRGPEEQD